MWTYYYSIQVSVRRKRWRGSWLIKIGSNTNDHCCTNAHGCTTYVNVDGSTTNVNGWRYATANDVTTTTSDYGNATANDGYAIANDATTNDATTNDAAANDVTTDDATTNDVTADDVATNDVATNDDASTNDGTTTTNDGYARNDGRNARNDARYDFSLFNNNNHFNFNYYEILIKYRSADKLNKT